MSDQPFNASALRGAVDLSGLGARPTAERSGTGAAPGAATGGQPGAGLDGLVVEGNDANFTEVVNASVRVPSIVVLWSAQLPQSGDFLDVVLQVARALEGKLQVVSINVDENPGLLRAFQVQSVPMTLGLVQGQPVPLFAGVQPEAQVRAYADELLKLAVQHGVTGRVGVDSEPPGEAPDDAAEPAEDELPPLHQQAYDAIERGDLDAAATAYEQALQQNPGDTDAELGLAQVGLMKRTEGVDLKAARAAAAADPDDIDAAIQVADLDVLGGHVEDAFTRLIDLVRTTAGDDRERVRTHLLELFAVVGQQDERVRKARTSLMSALF